MRRFRPTVLALLGLLLVASASAPVHAQMHLPPDSFEDVVERAEARDTPILLEIYTSWCPYCQRMQETVYADSTVRSYLSETFTYARLNRDTTVGTHRFDGRTFTTRELAQAFGARGVPTTVFLEPDGTLIAHQPGFIQRSMFLDMIRFVGSDAYRNQNFQEYAGSTGK